LAIRLLDISCSVHFRHADSSRLATFYELKHLRVNPVGRICDQGQASKQADNKAQ
jgi:hypothetical protein